MRFLVLTLCGLAACSVVACSNHCRAQAEPDAQAPAAVPETPSGLVPGPSAYGLDQVEDVSILRPEDAQAYYGLLHHASGVSQEELWEAGRKFIKERQQLSHEATFPDMLHHPQDFRGQPVALYGHLLQTVEYDAQPNPWGIEKLYEAALYTDDSVHHPLTVIFLEKPPELPLGSEQVGSVGIAGYFMKMYLYPSNDHKTRKAPLILAKTITVFPTDKPRPIASVPLVFGIVAVLILLVVAAVWVGWRHDRKRQLERRRKDLDQALPPFESLP